MDHNNRYVDVDDIWKKGLSSSVEFRTSADPRKIDASEIVNYSRIEEAYSEAIKAMRKYSIDTNVCNLEED